MKNGRLRTLSFLVAVASMTPGMVAAGLAAAPGALAARNVDCDKGGDLQDTIDSAPDPGTVLVKGTCHGNFKVGDQTLTIKGNPSAILDGDDAGRTLEQAPSSKAVHLSHLTITGGAGVSAGGGILGYGPLTLYGVTVTGNEASGSPADGGGVLSNSKLIIRSSTISSNRATAVGSNALALGGGVAADGEIVITDSVVSGNHAIASSPSGIPTAEGGGLSFGTLTLTDTKLTGNRVAASGDGGVAKGAALYAGTVGDAASITGAVVSGNKAAVLSTTTHTPAAQAAVFWQGSQELSISGSKISGNLSWARAPGTQAHVTSTAVEGNGAVTITRSSIRNNEGVASGQSAFLSNAGVAGTGLTLTRSVVSGNSGRATSLAGSATARGIVSANGFGQTAALSRSTVDRNTLTALAKGGLSEAGDVVGAFFVQATGSTISRNSVTARASTAGQTASAEAGGVSAVAATIKNSTIALNHVRGVSPMSGGTTEVEGGGLLLSSGSLIADTVAGNTVSGTGETLKRRGGGLSGTDGVHLKGTMIASNGALHGPDCYGGPTSDGHNFIGKTAGCSYTHKTTDRVNENARLGGLRNNGGPTQTIGIKVTSPAHDAIASGACPVHKDQRGASRPQGPRCDMGAFELKPGEVVLVSSPRSAAPGTAPVAVTSSASPPTVNCNAGGDLQAAMTSAPPGGTILVRGTCYGHFETSKSVTLKGSPSATLDGLDTGRTIRVLTNHTTLHLVGLTVTGGLAQSGAGVSSQGSIALKRVRVVGNEAVAASSNAVGGGVKAADNLTIVSSRITSNRASGFGSGSGAFGGGISAEGQITVTGSVISGNQATASSGTTPEGFGGGIFAGSVGARVKVSTTRFTGNRVGASGDGSRASGAALYDEGSPSVSLSKIVVSGNVAGASSTTSSASSAGQTVFATTDTSISSSRIEDNTATVNISSSGAGQGGYVTGVGVSINGGSLTVTGSAVVGNTGTSSGPQGFVGGVALIANALDLSRVRVIDNHGRATASHGSAQVSGILSTSSTLTLARSTVDRNSLAASATLGDASAYGTVNGASKVISSTASRNSLTARTHTSFFTASALGGGLYSGSAGTIVRNSTIALNHVKATSPASGGTTVSQGGGLIQYSTASLVDTTVSRNTASGAGENASVQGGGLYDATGHVKLEATIIALNNALAGQDCFGGPISNGHNLIGKGAGCSFHKKTTDKVNRTPRLGTLRNNGGATQTIGIRGTSPARDAIPVAACPIGMDQRGVHRPQGPGCDIGAFERRPGEVVAIRS